MNESTIELFKQEIREALFLNVDEFGLEVVGDEIISRFIGLHLHSEFQPIWERGAGGALLGYQASLRILVGGAPVAPLFAFNYANDCGKLVTFDRVARTLHMLNYLSLYENRGLLFVSVYPDLLVKVNAHGRVFEKILQARSVPTRQVVICITENAVETEQKLVEAVGNYRDCGYRIGIDDFGSKHSNFDRLWKLAPDYVKLDASLVARAKTSPKAQRALSKLVALIRGMDAQPIIKGVDGASLADIAQSAGASLFQGSLYGEPAQANRWVCAKPAIPAAPFHFGGFGETSW